MEEESHGAFFVVGLNRQDGAIVARPDRSLVVEVGDGVIVVMRPGEAGTIDSLFHKR